MKLDLIRRKKHEITYRIDSHSSLKIIHTTQHQIHTLSLFKATITGTHTQSNKQMSNTLKPNKHKFHYGQWIRTHSPDAVHEMCKVVHSSDVVIVLLKYNIWIDISVGQWELRISCVMLFLPHSISDLTGFRSIMVRRVNKVSIQLKCTS